MSSKKLPTSVSMYAKNKWRKKMKIYVVETISDYLVQVGFSPSKEKAQEMADERNKTKPSWHSDYFVTKYETKKNNDFCEFD